MVAVSRTAAAGIAVLSALNHVAATSALAGDASSNEARDVLNESSEAVALDARDFGDDVPETRDLMEGADPELNKRLFPLIGIGAKIGAKAAAKAAAKKAARKGAQKAAKKGGSEGAKHQHQKKQNKKNNKNNKKKGRRSLEDDDTLEVRDVLEPLEFEIRDLMESGDPELNKRLFPLIGIGAKIGAKAAAKAAAKKAARKGAQKAAKKGGSEGAKHQHQKKQNKKNNKKKGRRSFDDDELSERDYEDELYERDLDDYFLEARDILGDASDFFETRAVRPKGGMSRTSRGHKGSPSMRPGGGRGRPSRGPVRIQSLLRPMRKGASRRSFDDAAEFFEE